MAELEIERIARAAWPSTAACAPRSGIAPASSRSARRRSAIAVSSAHRAAALRRLQAGHRHAQGDGADLEEGALRRRRGLDRPGLVERVYAVSAARYREGVGADTDDLFPAAPAPEPPGSTSGRSIPARCALGAPHRRPARRRRRASASSAILEAQVRSSSQRPSSKLRHDRGTMIVSVGAYTLLWGWQFAVLFVLLLFVHEAGHAIAMRQRGHPAERARVHPVPRRGDLDARRCRGTPRSRRRSGSRARCSARIGAAVVLGLGELTDSRAAAGGGLHGFLLNLFNLLPIVPLDGGRAMAAVHPSLWIAGHRRPGGAARLARRTRSSS